MVRRAPVLIVSSHAGTQDAYVTLLRDLRTPAIGVDSVEDACRLLRHLPVRAALFHVLRGGDWEDCRRLRDMLPDGSPVLVLSERLQDDGEFRRLARRIGCSGFVARRCAPQAVVNALHRATSGERWTEYGGGV